MFRLTHSWYNCQTAHCTTIPVWRWSGLSFWSFYPYLNDMHKIHIKIVVFPKFLGIWLYVFLIFLPPSQCLLIPHPLSSSESHNQLSLGPPLSGSLPWSLSLFVHLKAPIVIIYLRHVAWLIRLIDQKPNYQKGMPPFHALSSTSIDFSWSLAN